VVVLGTAIDHPLKHLRMNQHVIEGILLVETVREQKFLEKQNETTQIANTIIQNAFML